ncbi:hypothetical protein GGI21_001795 [Coemansia aciculifera]|nr:hypothetical protein GGI21_001795 [Coemansia aciculifera]
MYPPAEYYSQSTDFDGQRSMSSSRRSNYARPPPPPPSQPQNYGFSSSSLFTPGDPGGFVLPSSGHHDHTSTHCGPSPLGFINPSEHIGHNHGQQHHQQQPFGFNNNGYPPNWQPQQQLGEPGGFAIPGANYPPPSFYPPAPPQMASYPPPPAAAVQQQAYAPLASAIHTHPHQHPRKTVHFHPPPYSAQDPYASTSEVSHNSTAVDYHNRGKRSDSVMGHSRPESVASRQSTASSIHTLVPNSPTTNAQSYATPNQIGMSVYNKHSDSSGNHLHSSSSQPRRHQLHNPRSAAYTWEDLRYNN